MPLLFIFLFTVISSLSFAAVVPEAKRSKAVDQALAKVEIKKNNPNAWAQANADKPYIGLLSEYDITLNDDWSFEEMYHARVKIQKEAAKELGEWPIYYNKAREEIVSVKAFVETIDGKKFEASQIQDLQVYDDAPMYSDMMVKVISLPQVNIGSVIDVQVKTKTLRKEIPNQFWDNLSSPVIPTKYARHTYVFPEDKKIKFSAYNNEAKPVVEKVGDSLKYSFVFEETEYEEDEEFMPPADEVSGVLSLSSMTDWKQVADWYRGLIDKNTVDDADISVKAIELTKDKVAQQDKARAILEFIQDDFRYVSMSLGDHTVEPHPTPDIFKNRYGDCKDLALLTRQMLKLAGIDSNICLFSGEFNGDPKHSLPNLASYDHVILELFLDGKKYFVDPQTKGFDFGQMPSSYDNAYVLVIEPIAFRFDRLPVEGVEHRSVISSSDITVNEDGSSVFDVKVKMPLEASQSFKQAWASTTDDKKDKFFEELEANFAQGGKMLERQVKGLSDRYGHVEFSLKYESPTAYPVVNDMILLKEEQQGDVPDFASASRKFPIFIPGNSLIKNRNTYHFSSTFKVDFIPQDFDLEVDFIAISSKYEKADQSVSVDSQYRMKRAIVSPDKYDVIKRFRAELYKKNDQYIVLKKKANIAPEAKEWIKKQ